MTGAARAAQRLRQWMRTMRSEAERIHRPACTDPITQIVLGIFSRNLPEARAREALERLQASVVDYNELRVISALELADMIGDYPEVRIKCEDLSRALNRIFAIEHTVSLDRLAGMTRRDVVAYLDRIDGLEPYTRARVRLLGLRQHAVPLDEAMWAYARSTQIVHPKCPLDEAQSFLERQIDECDGLEFFALLRRQAWQEMGAAVRRGEVPRIRSVPPDRTSRNMLRQVAAGLPATRESLAPASAAVARGKPAAKAPAKPSRSQKTQRTGLAAKNGAPRAAAARSRPSANTARRDRAKSASRRSRR